MLLKVLILKGVRKTMPLKCIEFKNSTDTKPQELYFYGDIVSDSWGKWSDEDTCPQDVQDILTQIDENKPLNIYINSGGGSVFAGLAIHNMLKRCQSQKTVYVDGLAGSIASVIAFCGDKLVMPSNAFLMIHKAWTLAVGNSNDLRKTADDLDRIESGIVNVYADNLVEGVDIETIKQMMEEETWLSGQEAAKYFNIELVEGNKAAASICDLSNYKNIPKELANKVIPKPKGQPEEPKNNAEEEEKIQNAQIEEEKQREIELAKARLNLAIA
jgi:ATP-dependent protease ClpP protease subunit